jgi:hypothetical protein
MRAHDEVRAFTADAVLQQRLAKYMVPQCFRNSVLEDFHSGIAPCSASGDYSDVTVSSPYGVIPWPRVSRLNDDEMKRLMIDVVDRAYLLIQTLLDDNARNNLLLFLAERDPLPHWNQPMLGRRAPETGAITAEGRTRRTARPLTSGELRGQPGLSQEAISALVTVQPATVQEALRLKGVGRKTTKRLLALGLLNDPEGMQHGGLTRGRLRGRS